ncbi:hypothetical protein F0562_015630 [Nyssa sinensis]|uniref:DUF4005 domain-containing protein n=1 Tax=Nyssa sinensis TaxID=561372 RepID=A0A5J4ZKN5_9ASTE|nr:hypothetical protein F0562_015630 [Nyssa sinensis]
MKMEKTTNFEDNKGPKTPSVPTQSRRSSLEGPRHINKDPGQIKISEAVSNHIQLEATSSQKCRQLQDTEAVSKSYSHISHDASMVNVYHQKAPRSPTSFAYQSQVVKTSSGTKIRPFQLPKTPEPPVLSRDEVQIMMQSELKDSRTPILTTNTNGKGSQIRKSLRTIGKLINGSEKRNQQKRSEARSPINGMSSMQDERSPPISASARALRRQSLTGIQTSDKSRRSSLGGNSANSCTNETRNAKTPPPVRASSKVTKRQL